MAESETKEQKTASQPASPSSPAAKASPPAGGSKSPPSSDGKPAVEPVKVRRRMVWALFWGFIITNLLMIMRFFFPRTLFEPKTIFAVGTPTDFGLGVDSRFQQQYRIWVVRKPERIFVIYARCTHLGCTPDWKESENKFKCPCHGSGYDSEGVNFEGPAPRPMDRARVELNAQGQVVVDVGKLFTCEKGKRCEFDDDGAFLVV